MAVKRIRYEEGTNTGYEYVEICYGDDEVKKFDSGDFVRDWYYLMKWIILDADLQEPLCNSSSVDHFIMDGAPYDSAYLIPDEDKTRLEYAESCWDECVDKGIEFFVPKGTKPTWKELKAICDDSN